MFPYCHAKIKCITSSTHLKPYYFHYKYIKLNPTNDFYHNTRLSVSGVWDICAKQHIMIRGNVFSSLLNILLLNVFKTQRTCHRTKTQNTVQPRTSKHKLRIGFHIFDRFFSTVRLHRCTAWDTPALYDMRNTAASTLQISRSCEAGFTPNLVPTVKTFTIYFQWVLCVSAAVFCFGVFL